nr:GGDEF domain-containing protein [Thermosipho globiformans]
MIKQNGNYICYNPEKDTIKKTTNLECFGVFDLNEKFYIVKDKYYLLRILFSYILYYLLMFFVAILFSYFLSKKLSKNIGYYLNKISTTLSKFSKKHFETVELEENMEEEIKVFVNTFNSVSNKLKYTLENMENIIFQKTNELKEKNKMLSELSIRDPLTNLYNRREFNQKFPKDFSLSKRENMYLNFAIIDIDHFKKINDYYGHLAGDTCLKKFQKFSN